MFGEKCIDKTRGEILNIESDVDLESMNVTLATII